MNDIKQKNTEYYKKVSYSETVLTELMIPSYSNFGGKIHGGIILSLMDKVAYACAAKHADAYCVTAGIEGVDFSSGRSWRASIVISLSKLCRQFIISNRYKSNFRKHKN